MQIIKNLFDDACVIGTRRFEDNRGAFEVTYEANAAYDIGMQHAFVQDNQSTSAQAGTIRGFHLQLRPFGQGKLIRVVRGRVLDVIVDLRPCSPTFGEHASVELDDASGHQLWIPSGFGHAFCTLEPDTTVFYKVDSAYEPAAERTLRWDDPAIDVEWPAWLTEPVLSPKDAAGLGFDEIRALVEGGTLWE